MHRVLVFLLVLFPLLASATGLNSETREALEESQHEGTAGRDAGGAAAPPGAAGPPMHDSIADLVEAVTSGELPVRYATRGSRVPYARYRYRDRCVAAGMDANRLALLLAVLHRHAGVAMYDQDVFINGITADVLVINQLAVILHHV